MTSRWLLRRILALIVTVFVGSLVVYGAMELAPGDPAALLVGGPRPSPAALAHVRHEFHLDEPFIERYGRWLLGAVHGDFGTSMANHAPVGQLIVARLGVTLFLVGYAALIAVGGGVLLGALAGWRQGPFSTAVTAVTTLLMAFPTFAVAVVLLLVFSSKLGWFPVYGSGSGFDSQLWHLTLPAVSLGVAWLAYVTNITQEAVREESGSEHVETSRARGLAERTILRRHVLRNASGPILAVGGLSIAGMLASTAVAEQAFGVEGIGALLVRSAARQDLAVVQAISLLLIVAFTIVNTVVDVISAALDPRLAAVAGA